MILFSEGAVSAAETLASNESVTTLNPIMHPNQTTLQRWIEQYEAAETVPIDQTIKDRAIQSTGARSLLSDLPYIASERNQNPIGNCWVWAGTGVLEVAHAEQTGIKDRLSIQYLDSNYNDGSGPDWAGEGGSLTDFVQFYNQQHIAVPWSNYNANFQDGQLWSLKNMQTWIPAASIQTTPHYDISSITGQKVQTRGVSQVTAITNIKAVLDQNRGIYLGFKLPDEAAWDDFETFWNDQGEDAVWDPSPYVSRTWDSNTGGGHAVLCIGYDDTDPNNRYWILVNSWGTAGGKRPNGIFRMKMDVDYSATYYGLYNLPAMQWETESVTFSATPQPVFTITTVAPIPASLGLSPKNNTMKSGGNLSLDLNLTPSVNGLSGYIITITSDNPQVASITSATLPAWAGMTSISTLPSSTVTVMGSDLSDQVHGAAQTIPLANLGITTGKAGTATLTVKVTGLSDDSGHPILTTSVPAVITVQAPNISSGVIPIQSNGDLLIGNQPTDPDHDGLYEDLNGNGVLDFNDITLFFNQMDWISGHEPLGAFDFNGNGQIDFNDIVILFNSL
ncbi:C1 family peptidase [Methanosphaerula palustris]|uniref:Peptidase C1A papain n=1 Tax=Methanosphaerula palustris (strain ATCC BAA-1556 / DSM 19958 / E1-9c) TaxID=521011 RepID=B8GFY0_METPE|nr:C1 family peptidase [Methanosphaerula palustris]ACL18013.1 peptidase C1A papain [Methanosphaerula palustris E1-9c]